MDVSTIACSAAFHREEVTIGAQEGRRVHGATVEFEFRGKSGQEWEIELRDRKVAAIVKRCEELPGYELFKYLDEHGEVQDVEVSAVTGACAKAT